MTKEIADRLYKSKKRMIIRCIDGIKKYEQYKLIKPEFSTFLDKEIEVKRRFINGLIKQDNRLLEIGCGLS